MSWDLGDELGTSSASCTASVELSFARLSVFCFSLPQFSVFAGDCEAFLSTMTMAMSFASSQAVLAVSCHKLSLPRRACLRSVRVLPSLRPPGSKARGLTLVRATSQVDTSAVPSSKETVPDTEISITKVSFSLRHTSLFARPHFCARGWNSGHGMRLIPLLLSLCRLRITSLEISGREMWRLFQHEMFLKEVA